MEAESDRALWYGWPREGGRAFFTMHPIATKSGKDCSKGKQGGGIQRYMETDSWRGRWNRSGRGTRVSLEICRLFCFRSIRPRNIERIGSVH